jgi:hypothetical protein
MFSRTDNMPAFRALRYRRTARARLSESVPCEPHWPMDGAFRGTIVNRTEFGSAGLGLVL